MHARSLIAAALLVLVVPANVSAQWTNRYPRWGTGRHVYVEGFEFPSLDAGALDPAPSPDGRSVAFSSRGWIWVLDNATGVARRITGALLRWTRVQRGHLMVRASRSCAMTRAARGS